MLQFNTLRFIVFSFLFISTMFTASAQWTLVENFNSYSTGTLTGGGWTVSGSTASVAADPANASNKVLSMSGTSGQAYNNMFTSTSTGVHTVFFRMRIGNIDNTSSTAGESAGYGGVTDAASPTGFSNYRTQIGVNPQFINQACTYTTPNHTATSYFHTASDGTIVNRYISGSTTTSPIASTWYNIWMVIDNNGFSDGGTAQYRVYIQGGTEYPTITQLSFLNYNLGSGYCSSPVTEMNLRSAGSLSTTEVTKAIFRSGGTNGNEIFYDDIYYASGSNTNLPIPSNADYRSIASGNWNDIATWQAFDGTRWVPAISAPTSSNSTYIQAGHTVSLTGNADCNNLFISTGTTDAATGGDGQVALANNTLTVGGKVSCYFGAVNTTSESTSALSVTANSTLPAAPITKTADGTGKLRFTGSSRTIFALGEWAVTNHTGATTVYDVEIAMNADQTATISTTRVKAYNWIITSGTLLTGTNGISVDDGSGTNCSVTIASGAKIIMRGQINRVNNVPMASFVINGTLEINETQYPALDTKSWVNNGTVIYSRAGDQAFLRPSGSAAVSASAVQITDYNNVVISGSGSKVLKAVGNNFDALTVPCNIRGLLSFTTPTGSPASLDIDYAYLASGSTGSSPLVLLSSATGTAQIGNTNGWTIANAYTPVTVERYIPSGRKWRALTAPLTGSSNNSIYYNWQNNGSATGSTGAIMWTPGGGTGLADGGTGSSVLTYTGTAWSGVSNTQSANLFDGSTNNAYMIFVTGPYNTVPSYLSSGTAATTLRATGFLRTGNIEMTVNPGAGNWQMIGNPYASPVSFSALSLSNINNQMYIWDARRNTLGGYRLWTGSNWVGGAPSGSSYGSMPVIQSGQAIFVQTPSAGNGTLSFSESAKVTTSSNAVFRTASSPEYASVILEKEIAGQFEQLDAAQVDFAAGGNNEFDNNDITKLPNFGENLAFIRNGKALINERRNILSQNDTLHLRLWNASNTNYRLIVDRTTFPASANYSCVLQDLFAGTEKVLTMSDTIQFALTAAPAGAGDRFRIVLRNNAITPVTNITRETGFAIYPNPVAKGGSLQLEFKNKAAGKYSVHVYNIAGVRVQENIVRHSGGTSVVSVNLKNQLSAGNYIVEMMNEKGEKEQLKIVVE